MADNKTVNIYVNTVEHTVPHQKISYATLIGLAFPGAAGINYIYKGFPICQAKPCLDRSHSD